MDENLISTEDGGKIEEMDFDLKGSESQFTKNKCPIDLKNNKEYVKLNCSIGSQDKGFEACYVNNANGLEYFEIIFAFFYSLVFYMLLILYFVDEKKEYNLLFYLIAVYIAGSFVQTLAVPRPYFYKTKTDLDKTMEQLLNLGAKIQFTNRDKKKQAQYPGCYTTDITGVLNVPKNINYVKIKGILVYGDKSYTDFKKDFENTYKLRNISKHLLTLYSEGQEYTFNKDETYILNTLSGAFSITCITRIACLFMLQWLNAIFEMKSEKKRCIDIYLVKLVSTEKKYFAPTKITVHGTTYKHNDYTYMGVNDEENEKFKNDLDAHKQHLADEAEKKRRQKEKEEQRKKERADNTEELSLFKSNNYKMRIYRYYKKVYLDLFCHEDTKNSYKKKEFELGEYDENIEENILDEDDQITYTPKGCDIEIVVKNFQYGYTIKIGTMFTKDFSYYSK